MRQPSSPVGRLPDEMLLEIFSHAHAEIFALCKNNNDTQKDKPTPEQLWMNVYHVSRRWRGLISATPSLWRILNVRMTNLDWLRFSLPLCRGASMRPRAEVYLRDPRALEGLSIIQDYAPCVKLLSLPSHRPWTSTAPLRDLLSSPLPGLSNLQVWCPSDFEHWGPVLEYTADLSPLRLPRLRNVTLELARPPSSTALYSQLRSLALHRCEWRLRFKQLLTVLAGCANLQQLTLVKTLNDLKDNKPVGRRVALPSLRTLDLRGNYASTTALLLDHLDLPSVTAVTIGYCGLNYDPACELPHDGQEGYFSSIVPDDLSPCSPKLHTLTSGRICANGSICQVRAFNKTRPDEGLTIMGEGGSHCYTEDLHYAVYDFNFFFSSVPLVDLEIEGAFDCVPVKDLRVLFRNFPNLDSLTLTGLRNETEHAWKALNPGPIPRINVPIKNREVLCPRLRVLTVRTHGAAEDCSYVSYKIFDELQKMLWSRALLKVRLDQLVLRLAYDDIAREKDIRGWYQDELSGAVREVVFEHSERPHKTFVPQKPARVRRQVARHTVYDHMGESQQQPDADTYSDLFLALKQVMPNTPPATRPQVRFPFRH